MIKQKFISMIASGAQQGYKQYHILPSITIAQAILETGWGKHMVGNNVFGIKAQAGYTGPKVTVQTTEYVRGKRVKVSADFRAYASYNESMVDHAKLLGESSRYQAVRSAKTYKEACIQLQKCGYATDPQYANKLIKLIEQNKLHAYDTIPQTPTSPTSLSAQQWVVEKHISDGKDPKGAVTKEMVWGMLYQYHNEFHK